MTHKKNGGARYRSRYLSHAKRALYHLSYAPLFGLHKNRNKNYLVLAICILNVQKYSGGAEYRSRYLFHVKHLSYDLSYNIKKPVTR